MRRRYSKLAERIDIEYRQDKRRKEKANHEHETTTIL